MSIHIEAAPGKIASRVLFPGDPLRAKWIAENFLTNVVQYSRVRNMLGFTGTAFEETPSEKRISVQGSGMGMSSLSIYANELFKDYGVQEIIRVGTCGGFREDMVPGDIVIAQAGCSDSAMNRRRFHGMDFAPIADWDLLSRAVELAKDMKIPVRVGNVLSTDLFYNDIDPDEWKLWAKYGVIAVEMETAELYTLAAKYGRKALSILTVSDILPTGKAIDADARERTLSGMIEMATRM